MKVSRLSLLIDKLQVDDGENPHGIKNQETNKPSRLFCLCGFPQGHTLPNHFPNS